MVYNAIAISKYIIDKMYQSDESITNLKLQKILYYVQGYMFKIENHEAFDDEITNWAYGPVVQSVYYEYCGFIAQPINISTDDDEDVWNIKSNRDFKDSREVIDKVCNATIPYEAFDLVRMTHEEAPWKLTHRNQDINTKKISDFFRANDPLNILGE